jgi:hypothetical protein
MLKQHCFLVFFIGHHFLDFEIEEEKKFNFGCDLGMNDLPQDPVNFVSKNDCIFFS